ncbi:small leucine-rich protein 1 [Platysternon megacephalum]|uniref:Small leucine-rich protein 1 n=1 Tax=Platysternon megacephalum TaxID=55544 RepID=A0A4D9DZ57_9SAUR|nr:small leucine-rich protein 1 [Platysternon megacephalum]
MRGFPSPPCPPTSCWGVGNGALQLLPGGQGVSPQGAVPDARGRGLRAAHPYVPSRVSQAPEQPGGGGVQSHWPPRPAFNPAPRRVQPALALMAEEPAGAAFVWTQCDSNGSPLPAPDLAPMGRVGSRAAPPFAPGGWALPLQSCGRVPRTLTGHGGCPPRAGQARKGALGPVPPCRRRRAAAASAIPAVVPNHGRETPRRERIRPQPSI